MIARRKGNGNIVKYLMEHGANDNEEKHYNIPLIMACKNGVENLVKLLIEQGADVNKIIMVTHH